MLPPQAQPKALADAVMRFMLGTGPGFPILKEMGCPTLVARAVGATGWEYETALEPHPSPKPGERVGQPAVSL